MFYKQFPIDAIFLEKLRQGLIDALGQEQELGSIQKNRFIKQFFRQYVPESLFDLEPMKYDKTAVIAKLEKTGEVISNVVEVDFKSFYPHALLKSEACPIEFKSFMAHCLFARFNSDDATFKKLCKTFTNVVIGMLGVEVDSNKPEDKYKDMLNMRFHRVHA